MQPNTNYRYRQPNLSSDNHVKASDSYVEGDIKANYNIELDNVFVGGSTKSSLGKLSTANSILQAVRVQYDVSFKETRARDVTSCLGKITGVMSVFETIKAQYNVILKTVEANEVRSSQGKIEWDCGSGKRPKAGLIQAEYDIVLDNIECASVKSSLGHVKAKNSSLGEVEGQYDISFINTVAKVVKSSLGKIFALNSELTSIISKYNLELTNTNAQNCYSQLGEIKITTAIKKMYNKLEAQYNMTLDNVGVTEAVVSHLGCVRAKHSHLPDVSCHSRLSLEFSRAMNVKMIASNKKEAVIELQDGVIDGDVTIEESTSYDIPDYMSISMINVIVAPGDGIVSINGRPYICSEPSKVKLTITGNGRINGNIIFNKCEGIVVSDPKIELRQQNC